MNTPIILAGRRGPLLVLATLALLVPVLAPAAQAQNTYRYWSYWWGSDGAWTFAESSPAERVVADGDVEGYLFLASAETTPSQQPGQAPDFAALCTGPVEAGKVRVGVVIDFGSAQDTPAGSEIPEGQNPQLNCAVVPEGSTGSDVIAATAVDLRVENGAICGISGYPATGCFEEVAAPDASGQASGQASAPASPNASAPADSQPDEPQTTAMGWILIGLLVAVIIAIFARMAINARNKRRR